ncbi:NINE protein [Rouxiella sp. Mn2063]|uniref:NINE protein n=1 Tax=Rouxiella sp. Mn2063 TaxID=3395262 RepID=UPI003BC96AA0
MSSMVFCRGCGKEIHETAISCPSCGAPQRVPTSGSLGEKNRLAAALLAFFLGGFGVHKFYLGKYGQGALYLIFCWTFIPSIIAFIEFIVYICTSDEDFARKYG